MKTKKGFQIIDLLFIVASIIYSLFFIKYSDLVINLSNIFSLIFVFILIHLFKCLRQYLLLMENSINIVEFSIMYIKTTFCSIVLPYKIGEIYRAIIYGKKINNYIKGIIMVLIDKFYDAILLLTVFIILKLKSNIILSPITWLLLAFCILSIIIYLSFKQTFYYLNKHFFLQSNSNRTLFVLSFLEKCNDLYDNIKNMIKGRGMLLLLLTTLTWISEFWFITILKDTNITSYINAAFFGIENNILPNYIVIYVTCIIIIGLLIYLKKLGGRNEKNNNNI